MTEHYKSVQIINLSAKNSRLGYDLFFERTETPPPADEQVEKLRKDYENAIIVLRNGPISDDDFTTLLNQLKAGAEVGLIGPKYDVSAGRNQLNQVQNAAARSVRARRNAYLVEMMWKAALFAILFLILGFVCLYEVPGWITAPDLQASYKSAFPWLTPFFLIHPGVALGVVFTALILNRSLTFDRIDSFDPYQFPPLLRLGYVAIISYVLLAALWYKWIMLGVGGYLLNDVTKDFAGGFAIGLICGIAEAAVVELMLRLKPVEKT